MHKGMHKMMFVYKIKAMRKGMHKMMCGYKIKAMHKGCVREWILR